MKPMKKRLLSLLLTLVTILSLLPTSAFAASNTGSGLKITTNQAYWSTRLLANGTPYSYRPPLVDGKLVYCMDSGLGYHYATPSYLNSFSWTSGSGADADAVFQSALTNSGLSEMDAATVENVKWMMTYLNDCKESNVGQLFMAVQTYVWENQSYKGEPGGDGDAGGYANADTYELYLSLIDSLLAKKAAEDAEFQHQIEEYKAQGIEASIVEDESAKWAVFAISSNRKNQSFFNYYGPRKLVTSEPAPDQPEQPTGGTGKIVLKKTAGGTTTGLAGARFSITMTFGNDKMGSLLIVKKDAVTGAPISDVGFFITDSDGSVIGNANGKYVTDSAGTIRIDDLTPGMTVIAKEARTKEGYILDDTPQSIKIKRNAVMTLEFRNQPKGGVLVKKVDAVTNAPISDVEFLVTDSDGNLIGNANGKFVTDSTGTFTITDIAPGTTLVIKEIRAKAGYILDDTPQTVKVKSNEVTTLEFRNQPKGNLIVVKQDSVTKEPLEGVQFKIAYADGSYVDAEGGTLSSNGLYWTDKEGKITISGISGTVVVTEVETITGYTIDENTRTQTVVVNPNDTQTLYFYNTPVGGLQIIKSDKDSGKRISGVKFEIRKMNGEIIGAYTTDSDGIIYLPKAESGWYTVTELEAASGYLLDTTPHRIEVKDGQTATLEIINHKSSRILLHKVDKATGKGIYGTVFLLYDSDHNPIGEYVTDQDGYIYADEGLADGRYYLREIKAAPGYVLDPELKTIYVRYGSTTEIEWSNTAECGQIQIIKKSADDNATNGLPAGTLLEGAVFEIYDKAGNVVDTIKSDRNGRAVSKTLPLSRYTVREIKAPANYSINPTVMTAYLEFNGQIVTFEVQNTSVSTGVSIKKTGPVQAVPGQPIRYVFSQIKNSSTTTFNSFYWRDTLPAQVTLSKIVTGSYNQPLSYKVVYKTNLSGDYRTLADNLSTSKVYVLDARPAVLGLAANERVTEVMFVFGCVKAGFAQVETPYIYATARSGLANNSGIVNVADVGGLYNGQWIQAVSRWLTTVYTKTTVKLPKTGY